MTHRVARRPDCADRSLAATLRRSAAGSHEAAEAALPRHPEATRHFRAIVIELAQKAHLLHRGISDDWNRVYLRHDLSKALRFARRAGFNGAPAARPELAALVGSHYQIRTISQMTPEAVASVCWSQACAKVQDLVDAVVETAGREASDHEGAA